MDEKQLLKFFEMKEMLSQNGGVSLLEAFKSFKNNEQLEASTSSACSPSTSKKSDKTYKIIKRSKDEVGVGNCVVCNAPSSKFHFGAIACAACCAFFRRSISEKRSYVCRYDRTGEKRCVVDYGRRCFCRACRLAKCLEKGMDPNGVQPHRDALGVKSAEPETSTARDEQPSSAEFTPNDPSNVEMDLAAEQLILLSKSPYMPNLFSGYQEPQREEVVKFAPTQPEAQNNFYEAPEKEETGERDGSPDSECDGENLVDRMVHSYEEMCERRRMYYCPQNLKDIIRGAPVVERPKTFQEKFDKEQMKFQIILYIEWFNSIPLFNELDLDCKEALIRSSMVCMALAEKYFFTMKKGGIESLRIISPNGWYTDLSDDGQHLRQEFGNLTDKDTMFKAFYRPLRDTLRQISGGMLSSKMTEIELCMLFGVILFNPAAPGLSEEGIRSISAARDCLFREWFRYYYVRGVDHNEASTLVGNTVLMIASIRSAVQHVRENFQMIRFFEIFEYDKIMDDFI